MTRVKPIALPTFNEVGGFLIGCMRRRIVEGYDARLDWNSHKHKDDLRERYVSKFRALYGDKFEYPDVDFYSKDRKISIVCPIHGLFMHTIQTHLSGRGCPYCNPVVRKNGKRTTYERLARTKKTRNIEQKEKVVKENVKVVKEKDKFLKVSLCSIKESRQRVRLPFLLFLTKMG